jgi:hypothetical protein
MMSSYLAIAAVTAVLRYRLQTVVTEAVNQANVTTRRPEAAHDGGQHKAAVNIFLYMVSLNPAWRNTDLEYRFPVSKTFPAGNIEKYPLMPLNLSYLFSFYGDEPRLEPQRLLGSVVSDLHARPRLVAQDIREMLNHDSEQSYLEDADLEEQVKHIEHITLTPTGLSLEELSKLWSVFFQVPYALSIAYTASTVLIEAGELVAHKAVQERPHIFISPQASLPEEQPPKEQPPKEQTPEMKP